MLSGMANNVNQIAHKANAMGYARVYQDNLVMTERLDNIIKRIEDDYLTQGLQNRSARLMKDWSRYIKAWGKCKTLQRESEI